MSEFRTRTFTAMAPHLRPHRSRRGARIVVTDGINVLLQADTDPGLPGSRWWVTPGGGVDAGETVREAAVRELAEETGLRVDPADLHGPVAVREVVHGYSDQVLHQAETFFVLFTERFEPDPTGRTDAEQLTLLGHAWLPVAELDASPKPIWPAGISELIERARASAPPLDLGVMEESTVPVAEAAVNRDRD